MNRKVVSLHEEYARSVRNKTRPRAFVRQLPTSILERLQATWRPTDTYGTFQDLLDGATTDAVAAQAADSSTQHLMKAIAGIQDARPVQAAQDTIIPSRAQLIADRLLLSRHAASSEGPELLPTVMAAIAELFEDAVANNRPRMEPTLLGFDIDMPDPIAPIAEPEPAPESDSPSDGEELVQPQCDIYDTLCREAEEHLPYLVHTLLPSVDVGDRLIDLSAGPQLTYTTRADYLLQLRRLEDRIAAVNPSLEAPGYRQLSKYQRYDVIKSIALAKYSREAKAVYPTFASDTDIMDELRALPCDAEERVIVPWRAYATKPTNGRQGGRNSTNNNERQANASSSNSGSSGGSGGQRKPAARKVDGPDPFIQFKDKAKYYVSPTWTKFCNVHGYNSNHTTKDCRAGNTQGTAPAAPKAPAANTSTTITPAREPTRPVAAPAAQSTRPTVNAANATDRTTASGMVLRSKDSLKKPVRYRLTEVVEDDDSDEGIIVTEAVEAGGRDDVKPSAFTVQALVEGKEMTALIDSGAALSCISTKTISSMALTTNIMEVPITLRVANGSTVEVTAQATADVCLPSTSGTVQTRVTFLVMPRDSERIIIGCDVLRNLGYLSERGLYIPLVPDTRPEDATDGLPPHKYLDAPTMVAAVEAPFSAPVKVHALNDRISVMLQQFDHLFNPVLSAEPSKMEPMSIPLHEDAPIVCLRPRRLPPAMQEWLNAHVGKLREEGVTQASKGPYASPVVLARKGTTWRLCVDYCKLNAHTIADHFPIPDMRELLRLAAGCTRFASLDLTSGYWQVEVNPADTPKTAFIAPGIYEEFTRMPFGLCNAPSHFQREMQRLLASHLYNGINPYVDDVFVYAHGDDEFMYLLEQLFTIADAAGLQFSAKKCDLANNRASIVGFIVDADGVHVDPARTQALRELGAPESVHELRTVLGKFQHLASFISCRRHELFKPLTNLLRKDVEFLWTDEHEACYNALKEQFTDDLFLGHPDDAAAWTLETDASNVGAGGVLWQTKDDKTEVLAYYSHTFSATQSRWSTCEQELFAIVYCVTHPSLTQLLRLKRFRLRTDHRNLIYMIYRSNENDKINLWRLTLADFRFDVEHVAGAQNVVADSLSRVGHHPEPPLHAIAVDDLKETIIALQTADPIVNAVPVDDDGLRRTEGLVTIPAGEAFEDVRQQLLATAHRGHHGQAATLRRLRDDGYIWVGAARDVNSHVARCPECQKARLRKRVESELLTTAVYKPFHTVAVDTVGPIPADDAGCRYIIVIVDLFTRYTELVPTSQNTAVNAASAIWRHVIARHGTPMFIKSDNGPEYTGAIVAELLALANITHQKTLPYHPQSNGVVERRNAEVMKHLRALILQFDSFSTWSELLPFVQLLLNTTICSATRLTPHEMLYGAHLDPSATWSKTSAPTFDLDNPITSAAAYVKHLRAHLDSLTSEGADTQRGVVAKRLTKANDGVTPANFAAGDLVLLNRIKTPKLHGHQGPFKIISIEPQNTLIVTDLFDGDSFACHRDQVIPFDTDAPLARLRELAASDDRAYVVDDIVGHRRDPDGLLELEVRWEGYEDTTFEPASALRHVTVARQYLSRRKLKLRGVGCHAVLADIARL